MTARSPGGSRQRLRRARRLRRRRRCTAPDRAWRRARSGRVGSLCRGSSARPLLSAAALLLAVVMGQIRRVSADRLARRSCRTGIRAPRYFVLSVAEELRVAHQEIREIAVIKVARSRIRHEDEKNRSAILMRILKTCTWKHCPPPRTLRTYSRQVGGGGGGVLATSARLESAASFGLSVLIWQDVFG